jgi:hypothetical protein
VEQLMTDTGDVDGTVLENKPVPVISDQQLAECLSSSASETAGN